jgi:2-dehydro-3-deoxygluconokinase
VSLSIKPAGDCRFDLVSLGECMIRLSPPGHGRIEFAPLLEVWIGGGEYNVAYALARLGLRAAWIGGLNASPMGRIVANHARAAGLDLSYAVTRSYDGIGKRDRIGLNFTEVGHGRRGSATHYDRGHSATAGIQPGEIDWVRLFKQDGVRWFHTGGIFTALSDATRQVAAEAIAAARETGTVVSYDLNFRSTLWSRKHSKMHSDTICPPRKLLGLLPTHRRFNPWSIASPATFQT